MISLNDQIISDINKKTEKNVKEVWRMVDLTLNTLGKKCPMPVLMTKKELKKMSSGQTLELITDDRGALKDVPALINKIGDKILETKEDGEQITFMIQKA